MVITIAVQALVSTQLGLALRPVEADLVAQVRQRLDATRFDQAFSAGSRLTEQEAITIIRDHNGTDTQTP